MTGRLLEILTLNLNAGEATATDRRMFEHLSIENGLSQSIVKAIVQDHAGFMWFGTEDGLNRYDGYEFVI